MLSRRRTGLLVGGTLTLGVLVLGPATAAAAANGQVCMGIVIDDGGYNGNGAVAQGANVAPGSSDLDAVQAAGDTYYQNNALLVCGIDDRNGAGEVPANGVQNCLATSGSDYYFWAYWEGDPYTNTWSYASIGPAAHTVSDGQTYVEGWSYQNPGPSTPSATKPSVTPAAAFALACPGVQPVPSGRSGGGGGGGGGGSGGGGSGGSGGGAPPVTPSPSASQATTTTTAAAAGTSSAAPRTAAGNPATSRAGATTTTSSGSAASAPPGGTHSTSTTTTSGGKATSHDDSHAALADSRPHGTPGGGNPALPIVIVAAAIALIGGLSWWRYRRRPAEE